MWQQRREMLIMMRTLLDHEISELDDEDELQRYLKEQFDNKGWDVSREVSPDESNYRVDLLLTHLTIGRIGIETKYVGVGDGPTSIARAYEQITDQYWDKRYSGEKILLWAICPYFERAYIDDEDGYNHQQVTFRSRWTANFFGHFGIGYLRVDRRYTLIDYGYSTSKRKIPAFPVTDDIPFRYYENIDIENIRASVRDKRGWSDE
jgi:hypothetical protein